MDVTSQNINGDSDSADRLIDLSFQILDNERDALLSQVETFLSAGLLEVSRRERIIKYSIKDGTYRYLTVDPVSALEYSGLIPISPETEGEIDRLLTFFARSQALAEL